MSVAAGLLIQMLAVLVNAFEKIPARQVKFKIIVIISIILLGALIVVGDIKMISMNHYK